MAWRPTRRSLALGVMGAAVSASGSSAASDIPGAGLSPWRRGELVIHLLATGRGDATLVVTPTGKSLLIDCGAAQGDPALMTPGAADPAAMIAGYVGRRLAETGGAGLDVAWITHLHDDHVSALPKLADAVPIARIIDPDFPDYGYPPFEGRAAIEAYVDFIRSRAASGGRVERLEVGRADQFDLAPVKIRALASRGKVWTGDGAGVRDRFPPRATLLPSEQPNENAAGSAIRLRFGAFSAFFGGDLTDWADAGARAWLDVLTPAAEACGPVDFALAPHHGLYDSGGVGFVRALQPKVWAISAWHDTHPSPSTLDRLTNARLNPRLKAVYATGIGASAAAMSRRLLPRLAGPFGTIVVRAAAGGAFAVSVVDAQSGADRVLKTSDYSA